MLEGAATPSGANRVVEVARGQYVELAQEDGDAIWTVLGEFGDLPHNTIPEPDRSQDNTTIWTEDFSQPYFDELLYSSADGVTSVANYYEELSSGRYTVTGEVEDWVSVTQHPAAYYGEGDDGRRPWEFVDDTVNTGYTGQLEAGRTAEEIDAHLSQFDVWDRYDADADGDFDEADGYIDHSTYGGLPAVPTFDDTQDWYVAPGEQADANGWTGVDVPKTGTRITVVSTGAQDTFVQVRVN